MDLFFERWLMTWLPMTYLEENTTGCCPVFNVDWRQDATITLTDQKFIVWTTWNFMYVPLNMKQMMWRIWKDIQEADASPDQSHRMMLSHDLSPRKSKHYFSVTKDIPWAETVTLPWTYITKVFEWPYKNMRWRMQEMKQHIEWREKQIEKIFAFYTTCPVCAKKYGKNYVVLLAKVCA